MARNQEKANSMLNRWVAFKKDEEAGGRLSAKRPALASMVDNVKDCERWRMQILRQIGKLIMTIQNESLGEQRIRDVNDEINKLLREKAHWERRIVELGGPNYRKFERVQDEKSLDGAAGMATPGGLTPADTNPDAPDHPGHVYKYFGAARNLPGVRELFRQREELKRARYDGKAADAAYYGFRDDDDGQLEAHERRAEQRAVQQALAAAAPDPLGLEPDQAAAAAAAAEAAASGELVSSLPVPSKEQMEQYLVKKRQEELLKKYVSANFIQEIEQSKSEIEVVLGKRKAE